MTSSLYLVSVDPGKTGAAAALKLENGQIALERVVSFAHDNEWYTTMYHWCLVLKPIHVAYEDVHSISGQGVKSTFTFGYHAGQPEIPAKLAGIPLVYFDPVKWQRKLGLPHHYEIPDRNKRRAALRKDQKEFVLAKFPELKSIVGDVYAAVCIGYASALEILYPTPLKPPEEIKCICGARLKEGEIHRNCPANYVRDWIRPAQTFKQEYPASIEESFRRQCDYEYHASPFGCAACGR